MTQGNAQPPEGQPGDAPAAVSVWQRLDRPAKAQRATLTHASIAAAAVDIADKDGLDSVSMRKLSGHLGVTTMALYRYVVGKEELFELMLDAAYAEYDHPVLPGETWRDVLTVHAHQLRAIALRHPWTVELAARRVVNITPRVMATVERSLGALDGLGLDIDTMAAAQHSVMAYVRGALTDEIGHAELMKSQQWADEDDLRNAYGPHMTWLLGTGRYPVYHRYGMGAVRKDDKAWRFAFGLDCVLDGIAARLGI
ncbi:MAG TPA: TetR/AcrR family transcriptional regulator C-terminal domain-containing protein [Yinghuangia sp.]|uniref:TetR/AcrR family transcriptional regulator C-terminal domain-containing protein n=1 Tax=Yinghuangia sp. YIM S10712 TaxID=3436930 RepID=UPI002BEC9C4B|nr:TetR/AcrR family transcriptional regulator C-terminal domain-containing protein [Yinghuangia sp.]